MEVRVQKLHDDVELVVVLVDEQVFQGDDVRVGAQVPASAQSWQIPRDRWIGVQKSRGGDGYRRKEGKISSGKKGVYCSTENYGRKGKREGRPEQTIPIDSLARTSTG